MPWKVTPAKWLQVEADRIEGLILMPKWWHRAWTANSLQKELADLGLFYSMPECIEVNAELHRRGVVEDIPPGPPA